MSVSLDGSAKGEEEMELLCVSAYDSRAYKRMGYVELTIGGHAWGEAWPSMNPREVPEKGTSPASQGQRFALCQSLLGNHLRPASRA